MAVHPDTHERVIKLQKDVEEIKEELEDQWHERRSVYEERVSRALSDDKNATVLYLEVDGVRSIREIERDLANRQARIPTMSLWRASMRLIKTGLIRKMSIRANSPVYEKKPWAKALDIDSYVKTNIAQQEKSSN